MLTNQLVLIVLIEAAMFAAIIILREPKLLIPAVVLGLPIEYPETRYLGAFGTSIVGEALRALLNPGKAAMVVTVVMGLLRYRHAPWKVIPNSSMIVPLFGLAGVVFLGVLWSDTLRPANSVAILPLYVAFVLVAPSFIENRRDVERIIGAFLIMASLLALTAIAQRVLHVFNWRAILVQSDDYSYRSNAVFADPNNLARFFAITLSLSAGLVLATGPRRQTVYLAVPALALGALGIITTASRSGWLNLIICTFLVVMMAPIARYTKAKLVLVSIGTMVFGVALLLVQGGTDAERVKSLTMGVDVIGQRSFLIKAGWAMFKDNPLVGVGSGNYQHALVESYLDLIPEWARTTLSHTSVISLLAELGIVGFSMFIFFVLRLTLALVHAYRAAHTVYTRLIVGWLAAAFTGILLQSQSEGRLLDEPFLWVLLALFVAMETRLVLANNEADEFDLATAEPAEAAMPTPVAQPVYATTTVSESPAG